MPAVFDPSNNERYPRGYVTSTLNQQQAGAYGSTMADQFVKDVIAGKDSLDVVVISDSNGAYSSNGGMLYAWEKGLLDAGAAAYATGIFPCGGATATVNQPAGKYSALAIEANQALIGTAQGGSASVSLGSAQTSLTAINNAWNGGSSGFKPAGPVLDWAYIASGTTFQSSQYVQLGATSSLGVTNELTYRVGYATFTTGSGSFKAGVFNQTDGAWISGTSYNTTGTSGYSIASHTLAANSGRSGKAIRFTKTDAFYGQGSVIGPVGFLFESVSRNVKGFAVTGMGVYSGGTTTQISDGMVASGDTTTTYLRELRERQILQGGSGRVLVFTYTGVNDVGAGNLSAWATKTNAMISHFQTKWTALGYPSSDLAFVVAVTHTQAAADTTLAAGRVLGKSEVSFGASNQVSFIDMNEMAPYTYLNTNSFYDAGGNSHLTLTGYAAVGALIVAALNK